MNSGTKETTIADGAVIIKMRAYTTPYHSFISKTVDDLIAQCVANGDINKDDIQGIENTGAIFKLLESHIVDMEFVFIDNPHIYSLQEYWEARTGDIKANWDIYLRTVSYEASTELVGAYSRTRGDGLPKSPEIIAKGKPDPKTTRKASKSGVKPSKKSIEKSEVIAIP
jgi:hypothetical protein